MYSCIYAYIHAYIETEIHIQMHTRTYIYINIFKRCIHECMYIYIYICIYIYIYIYYIYICFSLPLHDFWIMGGWIVSMLLQDYSLQPRRFFCGADASGMWSRSVWRAGSTFGRAGRADDRHSVVPGWVQVRSDRSGHVDNEVAGGDVWQLTQTGLGFENELALASC